MLTLITGVPGSGKSLRAVYELKKALDAGRPCYSDIEGLNMPGVLPAPDDWRTTPEGSFIVYDEAQKRPEFASTGRPGLSEHPCTRALNEHRHTGHDIVFCTQMPTMLHHHIRGLVGRHVHVHRGAGLSLVNVRTWDTVQLDPNDYHAKQSADVEAWKYPKDLFPLYKSSTLHTHKVRVPAKLKWAGGAIAVLLLGLVFGVHHVMAAFHAEDHGSLTSKLRAAQSGHVGLGPAAASTAALSPKWRWTEARTVPPVAGCFSSGNMCGCYGRNGHLLDITHAECLTALSRPLPLDLYGSRGSGRSRMSAHHPAGASSSVLPRPALISRAPAVASAAGSQSGWGTRSSALRVDYVPPTYKGGVTSPAPPVGASGAGAGQ